MGSRGPPFGVRAALAAPAEGTLRVVEAVAPPIRGPTGAIAVTVAPAHAGALEAAAADATDHLDEEERRPTRVVVPAPSDPLGPILGEVGAVIGRLLEGPSSASSREGAPNAPGPPATRAASAKPPVRIQVPGVVDVAGPRLALPAIRRLLAVAPAASTVPKAAARQRPQPTCRLLAQDEQTASPAQTDAPAVPSPHVLVVATAEVTGQATRSGPTQNPSLVGPRQRPTNVFHRRLGVATRLGAVVPRRRSRVSGGVDDPEDRTWRVLPVGQAPVVAGLGTPVPAADEEAPT